MDVTLKYKKLLREITVSLPNLKYLQALQTTAPSNKSLLDYKKSWKHDILKAFNEKHSEPLPDIRKPKEKKHIFYGVNTMCIEHG